MENDVDLDAIKKAAEAALNMHEHGNIADVALAAANSFPPYASEFDRGMAAGYAVGSVLELQKYALEKDFPYKAAVG